MIPEHQAQLKVATEVAVVAAANVFSWGLQDSVALASLVLSIATTFWVITQLIRFLQKWIREDHILDKPKPDAGDTT